MWEVVVMVFAFYYIDGLDILDDLILDVGAKKFRAFNYVIYDYQDYEDIDLDSFDEDLLEGFSITTSKDIRFERVLVTENTPIIARKTDIEDFMTLKVMDRMAFTLNEYREVEREVVDYILDKVKLCPPASDYVVHMVSDFEKFFSDRTDFDNLKNTLEKEIDLALENGDRGEFKRLSKLYKRVKMED